MNPARTHTLTLHSSPLWSVVGGSSDRFLISADPHMPWSWYAGPALTLTVTYPNPSIWYTHWLAEGVTHEWPCFVTARPATCQKSQEEEDWRMKNGCCVCVREVTEGRTAHVLINTEIKWITNQLILDHNSFYCSFIHARCTFFGFLVVIFILLLWFRAWFCLHHLLIFLFLLYWESKKREKKGEAKRALMLINSCCNFPSCCVPPSPPSCQNNHSQTCTGTPD